MHKLKAALVGLLCLGAVSACTTNTNPGDVKFTTVATLQLAVGTLNDTSGALRSQTSGSALGPGVFLDAIATFRNQLGNSAFLLPGTAELTPTADGPCDFTTGAGCNIGQNSASHALFSYGQQPGENGFIAAAPAWAAPGSGTGFLQDVILDDLPPLGAGGTSYSLTDKVIVNGQQQSYSAAATLNLAPTILAAAGNAVYAPAAGTGGGTFTFAAYPALATEQVVVVLDSVPPDANVLAMAEVCTVGCPNTGLTAVLPPGTLDTNPLTLPHVYTCLVIAADFPWVEAGATNAPAVGIANPTIVGALGNADLSAGATYTGAPCTQT
jgi:hypothetical protein